jgi:hypothetical protein
MERHLKDAEPKWALIRWPDGIAPNGDIVDPELPCCIPITDLDVAMTFGAEHVGSEDADFCKPRARVMPDPILLRLRFNHPYPMRPREGDTT